MVIDITSRRSRWAILLGALGGAAASVAATVGRAGPASATNGDTVLVGHTYAATSTTRIDATGSASAFYGTSDAYVGVNGGSNSGFGVLGGSNSNIGVYGNSDATDQPAIPAGPSATAPACRATAARPASPAVPAKTGVYGVANQDAKSIGVCGRSDAGTRCLRHQPQWQGHLRRQRHGQRHLRTEQRHEGGRDDRQRSQGGSTGVYGFSGTGNLPPLPPRPASTAMPTRTVQPWVSVASHPRVVAASSPAARPSCGWCPPRPQATRRRERPVTCSSIGFTTCGSAKAPRTG